MNEKLIQEEAKIVSKVYDYGQERTCFLEGVDFVFRHIREVNNGHVFDQDKLQERLDQINEIHITAIKFARWIHESGYIYAGEGDYMYPDADGLIGGYALFNLFFETKLSKTQ